jgi:endonuclease/exonuclease/phosphatase family metal-dependent hydrolase
MRVLTCNIRTSHAEDGPNGWAFRRDVCADVIRSRRPDVICFQEMSREQHEDLTARLDGYASLGTNDKPGGADPVDSICYRSEAFAVRSVGAYWLSRTPQVTGSKSWASRAVRLATWVVLYERGAQSEWRIVNTHLDHISQRARVGQARVIARDCAAWPDGYRQVLTGDLNCDTRNRAIAVLRAAGFRDTYEAVHGTADPGHTFHRFDGPGHHGRIGKMDWIFARGPVRIAGAEVIRDRVGDRYPSDHYFVGADLG